MLRSFADVRWDDLIRNDDIRAKLEQPPVSLKLKSARMKWLGHIKRMGEQMQVKKFFKADMQGTRPVGSPRTRWKDVLLRDLERSGLSFKEATTEAQYQDAYMSKVRPNLAFFFIFKVTGCCLGAG